MTARERKQVRCPGFTGTHRRTAEGQRMLLAQMGKNGSTGTGSQSRPNRQASRRKGSDRQ